MNTEEKNTQAPKITVIKSVVDAVTRDTIPTNNKQLASTANRYGISVEELIKSYVGQKGRQQILAEKLTAMEAIAKYNLHPSVVAILRCIAKPQKEKKSKVIMEPISEPPTTGEIVPDSPEKEEFEDVTVVYTEETVNA